MAENTKRSLLGFHGIFGILISIVGLLSILFTLMYYAVGAQRNATERPYDPAPIRDVNNVKKISVDNKQFSFVEAKNKDK